MFKQSLLRGSFLKSLTVNKLSAAVAAVALAAPVAQADGFDLSEKLTLSGFIDMSSVYIDQDNAESVANSGLDQVEFQFGFDFGQGLTATVDVEYQDNGTGEEVDVEQAYFSYGFSDALSFKAGRFLSYSGWETEDPTGLFQFSGTGYAKYFYGGYQQGASVYYKAGMVDVAMSVVNDLGDLEGEARDSKNPAIETMVAFYPMEAVTVKAFYSMDKSDINGEDISLINVWGSYSTGGLTLAAEVNSSENTPASSFAGPEAEAEGYLLMANYAWDKYGLTLRYHESEVETAAGVTVEDLTGFTIAPSITVTENLLVVLEYRMDEDDISGDDTDTFAVEALITF